MSRVQVFLSSVYASRLSSPCPLVIAYISSWGEAGEIFVRYLFLRSRINKFAVKSSKERCSELYPSCIGGKQGRCIEQSNAPKRALGYY